MSPLSLPLSLLVLGVLCTVRVCAYLPKGCNGRLDIVFVLDQSVSIVDNDPPDKPFYSWNILKSFVKALLSDLPVGDVTRTALIKYSSSPELKWGLDTYHSPGQVYDALDALTLDGGNTNTASALDMVSQLVFFDNSIHRPNTANVVVLLTDGLSTIRSGEVAGIAERLRNASVVIYVVAIGKYLDQKELRSIVSDFSKNIIIADDVSQLGFTQRLLLHRVCGLPDPDPTDDNVPLPSNKIMDIALIVDNSGSVKSNYEELKQFLSYFVKRFDVSPNQNRIAVVRFSDIAQLEFRLGEIVERKMMQEAILNMPFRDLDTNTSGGIRFTYEQVFSGSPGDRPQVPNVAILITDGVSTVEQNQTLPEVLRAKAAGVTFFVVGITNKINVQELQQIASRPISQHYFDSTSVMYLNALLYRLISNVFISS